MQTASTPAPYPPTHPPIQNGYQPLTESEIYAIKRQYLGLLPPLQIIDICLTFEAHAPLHIKSTVWPYDIRAAIAAIQAQNAQNSQPPLPQQLTPPVAAGDQSKSSSPPEDLPSDTGDKTASSSEQPQNTPPGPSVTHGPASGSATPHPSAAAHPPHPPQQSLPHYPHQPYYHPSYPHAPYYPAPPQAHFNFPHPYPSFPHPPPAQYQPNPPPPPPSSHPPPPPLFTTAPLAHPSHPPEPPPPPNAVDDLPSYEEMIVEALIDFGDPEGCAPKALFSWMASHYPLQSNFRPSASQALQKAFKRGRLEKGNNGKYRLNSHWEGGNTSKRTTRRPQTHAQTSLPVHQGHASSSPFTHIPLVHDADAGASSSQSRPSAQGGQPGYPYFGYQGPSTSAVNPRSQPGPSETQTQTAEGQVRESTDAWEAAQNILKAINFGQLFQISNEDGAESHADTATVAQAPLPVFAGSVEVSSTFDSQAVSTTVGVSLPSRNTETRTELSSDERAALQAELALLAAQLAEFADVSEDELAQDLNPPRSVEEGYVSAATTKSQDSPYSVHPPADQIDSEDDEDDDMDMVEVHVPMASLTA
ncbi:hypothetical protein DFH29DRAFT_927051 [Suillus ampliporus]|nr:hypothetical protein DFH29DRAFT_927051 [Suillus ampliporus]